MIMQMMEGIMMELDEAIAHALEVAEQNETQADKIGRQLIGSAIDKYATDCRECAADHRQLAEWLMEYKDLKAEQNDQYVFIHELMSELKEAKRLLKAAMEDMEILYETGKDEGCLGIEFKWRYADEAKKLLNDEKINNVE
jgi:hypothetical protein